MREDTSCLFLDMLDEIFEVLGLLGTKDLVRGDLAHIRREALEDSGHVWKCESGEECQW